MKTLKVVLVAATALILLLTPRAAAAQSTPCNLIYQTGINSDEPPGAPDGNCPESLPIIGSVVGLVGALSLAVYSLFRSFVRGASYRSIGRSDGTSVTTASGQPEADPAAKKGASAERPKPSNSNVAPEVAARLPSDWRPSPNRRKVGVRWQDPQNPGNGVRVDQGDPAQALPTQQVDHVIVRFNGRVIGRDGRPILVAIRKDPVNAHIPLSEYLTWRTWNSP